MVAEDRAHLGTPERPIGFVNAEGFAVVPEKVELVLVNTARHGPAGMLGFGERPPGEFAFHARYWGTSMKVPIRVDVGGRSFALRHGEYRVARGDPQGVQIALEPGRVRITAGDETKTIDTRTGGVE